MALDRRALRGGSPAERLSTVLLKRQGWPRQANFKALKGLEFCAGQMMRFENEIQFQVDSQNQANVNGAHAMWLSQHFISGGLINPQQTNLLFVPELFGQLLIQFHQVEVIHDQQGQPVWLVQANIPVSASDCTPATLSVFHNEQGNLQINAFDGFLSSVSGLEPAVFTVFEETSDQDPSEQEGQTVQQEDDGLGGASGMDTLQINGDDEKKDSEKPAWLSEDYKPSKRALFSPVGITVVWCAGQTSSASISRSSF